MSATVTLPHRACGLALVLWGMIMSRAVAQPGAEHRFMWDQANARVAAAQTPADFAGAANLYHQLILRDVRNAPLFYNYGIALLEANRAEDAVRAFQRAERYAGNDPDVRQNLTTALSRLDASQDSPLPWYRVFMFWHFGLDLSTRLAVALAGFSLLCLSLALRLWNLRGAATYLHGIAVAVLVIFGSSVGASLHAESRDQTRERALRTIEAKSPTSSGPAHDDATHP
ncbi:MAG: tetratricopeptide repeat protein [Lentisphaerae bacterium]|nr:tetratricopeptide repeat protein [Lentisphaerota bacterium]